jgi:hypothetical protein
MIVLWIWTVCIFTNYISYYYVHQLLFSIFKNAHRTVLHMKRQLNKVFRVFGITVKNTLLATT